MSFLKFAGGAALGFLAHDLMARAMDAEMARRERVARMFPYGGCVAFRAVFP